MIFIVQNTTKRSFNVLVESIIKIELLLQPSERKRSEHLLQGRGATEQRIWILFQDENLTIKILLQYSGFRDICHHNHPIHKDKTIMNFD